MAVGTQGSLKAARARRLGWQPSFRSLKI